MQILDIHTHATAPLPNALVCAAPVGFNPVCGQYYSVGIHPWNTTDDIPVPVWEALEKAAFSPHVLAIGECGIDKLKGGPLFRQMLVMKRQAQLSEKSCKPLVIHDVRSHDIVIGMHRDLQPAQNWLVHGFRGKLSVAEMYLKEGIWLSFGPLFNEQTLRAVESSGRILVETDNSGLPVREVVSRLSLAAGRPMEADFLKAAAAYLGPRS